MKLIASIKWKIRKASPELFAKLKAIKKPLNPLLSALKFGTFGTDNITGKVGYLKRKLFPNLPSKYSRVKSLKGIHAGKKCFIVATGPSLTIEDLNLLKLRSGGGAL